MTQRRDDNDDGGDKGRFADPLYTRIADTLYTLCPFCKRDLMMGYGDDDIFYAQHAAPACATFDELEPLEYLAAVDDAYGPDRA